MNRRHLRFLFLNVGHFFDHFFILIFASVAALRLTDEWGMSYSELIPYATPGLVAFGLFSIPAGWIADKWSRAGMMVIFFVGIGASSIYLSFANSPWDLAIRLTLVGVFAAIYHPVGIAMVVQDRAKTGIPLAINGIFGNMGVASAALITGILIDNYGWRNAFLMPGIISISVGLLYLAFELKEEGFAPSKCVTESQEAQPKELSNRLIYRVFAIILITTALGGLIFQSTTFSLPKIFDERLGTLAETATLVGFYAFVVFSMAAFAQLVVGWLIDNHSIRNIFALIAIMQTVLFVIMIQLTGLFALIVSTAFMLMVFGQIPINAVLVGKIAKNEWRSRAYSVTYLISFTVSASAVPLIARVHGSWGFDRLFVLLAVLAFLIFIAAVCIPKDWEIIKQSSNPANLHSNNY